MCDDRTAVEEAWLIFVVFETQSEVVSEFKEQKNLVL